MAGMSAGQQARWGKSERGRQAAKQMFYGWSREIVEQPLSSFKTNRHYVTADTLNRCSIHFCSC